VQTAAAPTYTIADCSEAVGYDGVNHTLTIQANSYTWANGDNLQSGPNVYGGGGIGSFAIQKYTPHTAFPGGGMNVQVRGVQDAEYAYTITADGSFRPNIRFDVGYVANYSHVGFNCEQSDISCLDSGPDVPLFRVGHGDAGGSWSARLASSLMGVHAALQRTRSSGYRPRRFLHTVSRGERNIKRAQPWSERSERP
jgi:hypothetical protein